MIKQLIRDALPKVIDKNEGAEQQFKAFVKKKLSGDPKMGVDLMAISITSKQPRERTLAWFVEELTQDSLQSKDQIFQIAAFFDIPSSMVHKQPHQLADVFKVRNRIIHELDIDFSGTNRKRVPRKRDDMEAHVAQILATAATILSEVDRRC